MSTLAKIFGIDLGTTYSCIAYVDEAGKPVIVKNAESERITPSVVFFDGDNVVVGNEAKNQSKIAPDLVVEMVKRNMGREGYLFQANGKDYRAEVISSFILRKVVGDAEKELNEKITDVVITCPAYFGVNEREATAKAGEIAGLNVRSIINEPTAAAIAYGMDRAGDQVVLVYDLGGGTFDITMIEIKDKTIAVVCTGGDHNLGGKDWDNAIVDYLAEEFRDQAGTSEDIRDDRETLQDLLWQAEQAKKTLSQREETDLKITHGGQRIKVKLTRDKFDELTANHLARTIELTRQMLLEAEIKGYSRYDKTLLVGGSTRMPQVSRRLKEEFGKEREMFDPDESVAKGAAIYGWKLALDDEIKIAIAEKTGQEAAEIDLGQMDAKTLGEAQKDVANEFGFSLPSVKKITEKTFVNVTSKTFGIVVQDRNGGLKVFNLIRRNDQVPVDGTKTFGTVEENQQVVEITLMENLSLDETAELSECTEIGNAELTNLPSGLRAGSPIEVNFRLNEQGRLEVLAKEPMSGETINIEVQTASVMSNEEVEQAKTVNRQLAVS